MKKIVLLFTVTVCCTGCGLGWTKPGATTEELHRDYYQCEREAAQMYPAWMVQDYRVDPRYDIPARMDCDKQGDRVSCTSMPGFYQPPLFQMRDANVPNRDRVMNACLRARGYESTW